MHLGAWSVVVVVAGVSGAACGFDTPPPLANDAGIIPMVGFLAGASLQDEQSGRVSVPLVLSDMPGGEVSVSYTFESDTAQRGSDFEGAGSTVTFAPGAQQASIELDIIADDLEEGDESFTIVLSSPLNATLGTSTHRVTISANLLPRASVTVAQSSGAESAPGALNVNLDRASATASTIEYAIDGDVTADDYAPISGTFVIPAGATAFELPIVLQDDALDEFDEKLRVTLTGSPDVIVTSQRTREHTILDNDEPPGLALATASIASDEGDTVDIVAQLAAVSGKPVTFTYSTAQGTNATATADYTYATPQSLTIPAGMTSATIQIAVVDDDTDENTETVLTKLDTADHATLGGGNHTLTINDGDGPPVVAFGTCGGSVREGVAGVSLARPLVLTPASGKPVTVTLGTDGAMGRADVGEDFTLSTSTVTFAPGETMKTFEIRTIQDARNEGDETIRILLQSADNATIDASADTCDTRLEDQI